MKKSTDLDDIANSITDLTDMVASSISELKVEFKKDISDLRTELKGDISDLRTELKGDISDLRTELKGDISKLQTGFSEMDRKFNQLLNEHRELREVVISIDGRLMGVESDIKEIYDSIGVILQNKVLTTEDKAELERKFAAMFDWAKEVSKKTGVALPKL